MIHPLKMIRVLGFIIVALSAQAAWAGATPSISVVGKYGFDWLQPAKAKCALITDPIAGSFKSCSYRGPDSNGSFTGKKDFYTCQVSKKSEYMIYSTKARCIEELETMKANAE